jgi:allantoin racemase
MAVKIYLQNIGPRDNPAYTGDGYLQVSAGMKKLYEKMTHQDTVVEEGFTTRFMTGTSHYYLETINDVEIIDGIIKAEARGFDVAMIRCGNDPALQQAREAVNIPVIGMVESGMHLATRLGGKFALLGVDDKSKPLTERNLRNYGLESRAIVNPVRCPHDPAWYGLLTRSPEWFASPEFVWENVVPIFERAAMECIEDGAEVICTACALYAAFTLAGYTKVTGTEVPVIEATAAGIKTAEMFGEMRQLTGLSTSKQLTYQNLIPAEMRDNLMAPYLV